MRRTASRQGDGSWRVEGLTIPVAGRWSVRVDILVSDFDLVTLEDDLVIRP
jgi:copper transport protein